MCAQLGKSSLVTKKTRMHSCLFLCISSAKYLRVDDSFGASPVSSAVQRGKCGQHVQGQVLATGCGRSPTPLSETGFCAKSSATTVAAPSYPNCNWPSSQVWGEQPAEAACEYRGTLIAVQPRAGDRKTRYDASSFGHSGVLCLCWGANVGAEGPGPLAAGTGLL
jgi:hypothetical protein